MSARGLHHANALSKCKNNGSDLASKLTSWQNRAVDTEINSSDYYQEVLFSWCQTALNKHTAMLGKMVTNDPAENPFASLA